MYPQFLTLLNILSTQPLRRSSVSMSSSSAWLASVSNFWGVNLFSIPRNFLNSSYIITLISEIVNNKLTIVSFSSSSSTAASLECLTHGCTAFLNSPFFGNSIILRGLAPYYCIYVQNNEVVNKQISETTNMSIGLKLCYIYDNIKVITWCMWKC